MVHAQKGNQQESYSQVHHSTIAQQGQFQVCLAIQQTWKVITIPKM